MSSGRKIKEELDQLQLACFLGVMDKNQYNCVLTAHSVCSELCPGEAGHGAKTCCYQEKGNTFLSPWVQPRNLLRFWEVFSFVTFPGHLL